MGTKLERRRDAASVVARLVEAPDLVQAVRGLSGAAFASLVREVGVEDAGELVALATTEQLVAAFDEDLFTAPVPGERERFAPERFVAWLEVLLEAGDAVAAGRVAELSEDFVAQALSSLLLVLDQDALMMRLSEGDDDSRLADKALESSLSEELDGYLLVARRTDGWDAALALVLALDRDHRALLERVLDRCASVDRAYVEDLEALTTVLSEAESLAEDAEGEREERRARKGYVEPRAARAFLELARAGDGGPPTRDAISKAYFRELAPLTGAATSVVTPVSPAGAESAARILAGLERASAAPLALPAGADAPGARVVAALGRLAEDAPEVFGQRMAELGYLANVLMSGASIEGRRLRPGEAAEAALATVALGAALAAPGARLDALIAALRQSPADILFRRASAALAAIPEAPAKGAVFVRDRAALDALDWPALRRG